MSGPGDRLFEQPTVKVFPDALPQSSGSAKGEGSQGMTESFKKKRVAVSEAHLSSLPPPPSILSTSIDTVPQTETKTQHGSSNAYAYASASSTVAPATSEAYHTSSSAPSVPSYAWAPPTTPDVVNQTSSAPSYLNFSAASAQPTPQAVTSTASYAVASGAVPLYAQFSAMSIEKVPTPPVETVVQSRPAPVAPAPYKPPPLAARSDYVLFHGYQEPQKSNISLEKAKPTPLPSSAKQALSWVSWNVPNHFSHRIQMNAYGSCSEDESFVLEQWFQSVDQDNSGLVPP